MNQLVCEKMAIRKKTGFLRNLRENPFCRYKIYPFFVSPLETLTARAFQ